MGFKESKGTFPLKHKKTKKKDHLGRLYHSNAILEGVLGEIKNKISDR